MDNALESLKLLSLCVAVCSDDAVECLASYISESCAVCCVQLVFPSAVHPPWMAMLLTRCRSISLCVLNPEPVQAFALPDVCTEVR